MPDVAMNPADAHPQLQRVNVAGQSIAYRRAGDGPALVLLHGFLCDSQCWRTQFRGLSEQFSVLAWDAPGCGASTDPSDSFALSDWAECLIGFLDALNIGPAHMVGLSWGGILAQELYRSHPARVRSLVLADTYAGWKGSFSEAVAQQRLERCRRESLLPAEDFVSLWVPKEFFTPAASPELAEEMAVVVANFHPHGFRLMAQALAETDFSLLLPKIDVPTLLLWGDADTRSPIDIVGAQFRDAIAGAELVVLKDAGHVSNMERPQEFNRALRDFCLRSRSA